MDADQAVKLYPLILRMTADLVYLTNYLNQPSLGCLKKQIFAQRKISYTNPKKQFFTLQKISYAYAFFGMS